MGDSGTTDGENMRGVRGCVIVLELLGVLTVLGALVLAALTRPYSAPPPRPDDQASFQADVIDDRKQLFAGRLTYESHISTAVDDSATYSISLTALGEEETDAKKPLQPAKETRDFQVGGVEGAKLTPTSRKVKVAPLADAKSKQIIAEPGDSADWLWSVTASEPGNYELMLTLTTYQRDSDRALATLTPPITVHLSVSDTWPHRIDSMRTSLIAWGSVAVALTALFAFRTPLTAFARTRRDAWREQRNRGKDGYL